MAYRMPKEVGELSITEELREFKELVNQTLWDDSREMRLEGLRKLMEQSMVQERENYLLARRYERNAMRRGYACGYYTRSFLTGEGLLEGLQVPRTRDGGFYPKALARYARRSKKIDVLIRSMYINGVSTRDVKDVMEGFVGAGVSASTVSEMAADLDAEVRVFHQRFLKDDYLCLLLDGVVLKSREFGKGRKRVVLTAVGIHKDGKRELIDFLTVDSEGEVQWAAFLNDLYRRGLKGKGLLLITTDGAPGLVLALAMTFPRVAHQRCWAHKLRNVANKLPVKHRERCVNEAAAIYSASSKNEAVKLFWEWAKKWRRVAPKAVTCLEKDIGPLLQFFSVPKPLWKAVRTTNPIERAFREVRRRTTPMGCFNNDKSIERTVYGVATKINKHWIRNHRCPKPLFAQKS